MWMILCDGFLKNLNMNFCPEVSLTHIASVAVISILWNQDNITAEIEKKLEGNPTHKDWAELENNVFSFVRILELPAELESNLENFIQPMGRQIINWITLTASAFQDFPFISKPIKFVWTEKGLLDYIKTARLIIKGNPNKELCFCLACIFCLDDVIWGFWPYVHNIIREKVKAQHIIENTFLIYWTYFINDEIEELKNLTEYYGPTSAYEFAFLFTLDRKCTSSLDYFLKRIDLIRKHRLIMLALQRIFRSTMNYFRDGNLVLFLLSHLTEPSAIQIKDEEPYRVLVSFLEWPYQECFMANAKSVQQHLSNSDYQNLFQELVEYVSKYYMGNVYKNLIKNFWQFTPTSFKEYVINKCISGNFLSRIFQYENTNCVIEMILNNCSANERQLIIFHSEGMDVCDFLVKKGRWQSLELFIKSCISSPAILEEFIDHYENYKPYYYRERTELRTDIFINKIREWY